jgi:hypothetical protein
MIILRACHPDFVFHVKMPLFVTAESEQDPDPHGSASVLAPWIRIRIEVKSWIRIRNRVENNADPQHCS